MAIGAALTLAATGAIGYDDAFAGFGDATVVYIAVPVFWPL